MEEGVGGVKLSSGFQPFQSLRLEMGKYPSARRQTLKWFDFLQSFIEFYFWKRKKDICRFFLLLSPSSKPCGLSRFTVLDRFEPWKAA